VAAGHGLVDLLHPLAGWRGQGTLVAADARTNFVAKQATHFVSGQVGDIDVIAIVLEAESVLVGAKAKIIDYHSGAAARQVR
jgi:hypothetical protein